MQSARKKLSTQIQLTKFSQRDFFSALYFATTNRAIRKDQSPLTKTSSKIFSSRYFVVKIKNACLMLLKSMALSFMKHN